MNDTGESGRGNAEQFERMLPGDHACVVYSGCGEKEAVLGAYIRAGLDAGERVAYLCGEPARATADWLCAADHRAPLGVASGQLVLMGAADDPRRTLERLQVLADEAMADGYPALRLATDVAQITGLAIAASSRPRGALGTTWTAACGAEQPASTRGCARPRLARWCACTRTVR